MGSITIAWHFNAFSGTQLIFSQAGTSAVFLWVPFPFGILLTFGKENTFSLLSLNRKILFPQKEMERNKNRTLEVPNHRRKDFFYLISLVTNIHYLWFL